MTKPPDLYVGDTKRSPVVVFTLSSVVCSLISVIIMAAYVPNPAPLIWPAAFLVASLLLLPVALIFLLRRRPFAWHRFFSVARWVFLMTLVFAGMLEYIFIYDGMLGQPLIIMSIVLVLTAIDIPLLWGFSVARHERVNS